MPTIAALHERGEAVARQVLAENNGRWESLSDADRERLELMAATIVKRLLQQPTLRLKARADDDGTYAYVQALRELFGLETEKLSAFEARRATSARRPRTTATRRRPKSPRSARADAAPETLKPLRIGTRGSALALVQANAVADRAAERWAAEVRDRSRSRPAATGAALRPPTSRGS